MPLHGPPRARPKADVGLAVPRWDNGLGTPGYIPPETWQTGKWYPKVVACTAAVA